MKALLQLIDSEENALKVLKISKNKNFNIVKKNSGEFFTKENIKSYMKQFPLRMHSYGRGKSKSFDKIWSISITESNQSTFSGLSIYFREDWGSPERTHSLNEQKNLVKQLGGAVVDSALSADIFVTNLGDDYENKDYKSILLIDENEFCKRAFTHSALTVPASKIKSVKGDASRLWKLLSARDLSSIKQGLALAKAVPEEIDNLIEGCNVAKSGELIKSTRFTGSGPAQIYLDFALLNLLSLAPNNSKASKIRQSIKKLSCKLNAIPNLVGFDNLIELAISDDYNNFENKDLNNFGLMPKLQSFTLENQSHGNYPKSIESLKGLNAPNLKKFVACSTAIFDISNLKICEKLEYVDLTDNGNLKSIDSLAGSSKSLVWLSLSGCSKLGSINALQGAINMRHLDLQYCESLKSLEPLSDCKEFSYLDFSGSGVNSLKGLENIILKDISVSYSCQPKDLILLSELISLSYSDRDSKFKISDFTIGEKEY